MVFEIWGVKLSKVMKKITETSKGSNGSGSVEGGGYIFSGHMVDHLVGRVLTHIETLGLRESQEKAIKDLLKQEIWAPFNGLQSGIIYVDESLERVIRSVQYQAREIKSRLVKGVEYTLTVEIETED